MKKTTALLFFLTFISFSKPASAYFVIDNVSKIVTHDSSAASYDYVTVYNADDLDCPKDTEGLNILSIRKDSQGNRQLAQLLAAKVAGRKVRVSFYNNIKDLYGNCILWRVLAI